MNSTHRSPADQKKLNIECYNRCDKPHSGYSIQKGMKQLNSTKRKSGRLQLRRWGIAALFLLPGVAATLLFKYYTMGKAIYLSFFKYDVQSPPGTFVGPDNFIALFRDMDYWRSWGNTLVFLLFSLFLTFLIPLIQALCLEPLTRFQGLATTLYILPAVIPGTIYIVLWKWIWNLSYGAANLLLGNLGIPVQAWLSSTAWVKFCIIFPGVIGGGMGVLLYLAAIYGVSEEVKEAAMLDGCTGFQRIWHITLPNIKFLLVINLVNATIGAMQMLDNIYQYTNGGPAGASESTALFIFHQYTMKYNYGMGSAASLTLMLVIAVLTFLNLRLSESQDE